MTRPPSPSLADARISLSRLRGRGTGTPKAGQGEGGRTFALLSALLLSACGLQPIYAGGAHGPAATTLGEIEVAPIPDRAGYLLRQQLRQRLDPGEHPAYRLEVVLDDKITGFGIRVDTSIARERRTLRARYRLVDAATNAALLDATAGSDEGIDVVQSEYAVVAAEQTALERFDRQSIRADHRAARVVRPPAPPRAARRGAGRRVASAADDRASRRPVTVARRARAARHARSGAPARGRADAADPLKVAR